MPAAGLTYTCLCRRAAARRVLFCRLTNYNLLLFLPLVLIICGIVGHVAHENTGKAIDAPPKGTYGTASTPPRCHRLSPSKLYLDSKQDVLRLEAECDSTRSRM
jgi:hypothetical protein